MMLTKRGINRRLERLEKIQARAELERDYPDTSAAAMAFAPASAEDERAYAHFLLRCISHGFVDLSKPQKPKK